MHHFNSSDFKNFSKVYRLNLINSVTGYKSANLIGSQSLDGKENLAIFSSVIHLGSNPALIGFILRPTTVPRHTYSNIKSTGIFTLNAVTKKVISDAHHTSAKYPDFISEFDKTNFEVEKKENWQAPFVKESPLQMGCRFKNEYHIKENDTILIVASIEHIFVSQTLLLDDGWVQLDKAGIVTINGLDAYSETKLLSRFKYARPKRSE